MALQDWKKIDHMGIPMWQNKKKYIVIGIRKPAVFHTRKYEVYIGGNASEELGEYSTLSLAVRKAKSYMRSH